MNQSKEENICEFCGQIVLPGETCKCPDAERERAKQQQAQEAKQSIKDIFETAELDDNVHLIMHAAVDLILNFKLNKLSLSLPGGDKSQYFQKCRRKA